MATIQNVTVKELRKAYNAGKATGRVSVAAIGLTMYGKAIDVINFRRYGVVDYVDASGKLLAVFQDQAAIDD